MAAFENPVQGKPIPVGKEIPIELHPSLDSLDAVSEQNDFSSARTLFVDGHDELLCLPTAARAEIVEPEVIRALKAGVEETTEKLIGEGAGISWHARNPQTISRPDLFAKFKDPFVLPGRQDETSLLYLGGLTSSGYPWRDYACKIYDRSGYHSEVYPLAGHDGTWQGLRDTNEEQWIKHIKELADRCPEPPVAFCFSTSLLAACIIEKRHPGTFRAIVGVGGPFHLKNEKLETYLDRGQVVDRIFRTMTFGTFSPISYGSVPMDLGEPVEHSKAIRRSPGYTRLPLNSALSLRRLQKKAAGVLSEINIPFFYAQGESDPVVSKKVPEMIKNTIGSETVEVKTYPASGHGPMLSKDRYAMLHDICSFLKNTLRADAKTSDVPDFDTRLKGPPAQSILRSIEPGPRLPEEKQS